MLVSCNQCAGTENGCAVDDGVEYHVPMVLVLPSLYDDPVSIPVSIWQRDLDRYNRSPNSHSNILPWKGLLLHSQDVISESLVIVMGYVV